MNFLSAGKWRFLFIASAMLLTAASPPARASDAIAADNAGNVSLRAGRHAEVVAWYDPAIARDPGYAPTWANRDIARSQPAVRRRDGIPGDA